MIKKLFAIAFVSVLALALVGCQSNIPDGLEREVYNKAVSAYELCQDWQNGQVSDDELTDGLLAYEGEMADSITEKSDPENTKMCARVMYVWTDIEIDENPEAAEDHIHELGKSLELE